MQTFIDDVRDQDLQQVCTLITTRHKTANDALAYALEYAAADHGSTEWLEARKTTKKKRTSKEHEEAISGRKMKSLRNQKL